MPGSGTAANTGAAIAAELDSLGAHRPADVWLAMEYLNLHAVLSFVPEPSTAVLLALGLSGLSIGRTRSSRRQP